MAQLLSVRQAADQLGVSHERVRQMLAAGDLEGEQLAGRWLLDRASVARRAARPRSAGRPFSPEAAWSVLASLAGPGPAALHGVADVLDVAWRLRRRAEPLHWYVHSSLLARLEQHPEVVIGGARASGELASDRGPLQLYAPAGAVAGLRESFRPVEPADDWNVVLRVIEGPWPFGPDVKVVWPVVAALDLLDDCAEDPRCRDVARRILEGVR